ncbi:Testis-expressed protein 11 [Borealophlyctis nickersoniae]|nr:Testis-expressed protein 11 [Borealophlyctis nickersoniae]
MLGTDSVLEKATDLAQEIHNVPDPQCERILGMCVEIAKAVQQMHSLQQEKPGDFERLVDRIDDFGVRLWNESVDRRARATAPNENKMLTVIAHLRDVAFNLLKLSAHNVMDAKTNCKMMGLAIKAGKSWVDAGDLDKAETCYDIASQRLPPKFQEQQKDLPHVPPEQASKLTALLFAHRAEREWQKAPSAVAFRLINQATSSELLELLDDKELSTIIRICVACGKFAEKSPERIQWYTTALEVFGHHSNIAKKPRSGLMALKAEILMDMAASHFSLNAVDTGEKFINLALRECPSLLPAYYLKCKILVQKGAQPFLLEEAFEAAARNCPLAREDAADFKIFMGMIHILAKHANQQSALKSIDTLLAQNAKGMPGPRRPYEDKLIISKLYLLASMEMEAGEAVTRVEQAVTEFTTQEFGPSTIRTCQLIIWQAGDRASQAHRWEDAIAWYKCSLALFLDNPADVRNAAILRRKMAYALFELGRLEEARDACTQAASDDDISAVNEFLFFLIALEEGKDDKALQHLQRVPQESGKIDIFINAADRAFKKGNKTVLKGILREIVISDIDWTEATNKQSLLVILRCLLRLTKKTLDASNDVALYEEICLYIKKSYELLRDWSQKDAGFQPEVDWLFRMSWNLGVGAATNSHIEVACRLYEMTSSILQLFPEQTVQTLQSQKICYFALLVGRVTLARREDMEFAEQLQKGDSALKSLRQTIADLRRLDATLASDDDPALIQSAYLEFEIKVKMRLWEDLSKVIEFADTINAPVQIFERMADIVTRHNCPSAVVFLTVQVALDAILKRDPSFDLGKFSQWFRVLVRTALVNNKPAAIGLYEQVKTIIKTSTGEVNYPEDEISWLMITACTNDYMNARTWCELALSLADYVKESAQADEMRRSYAEILESVPTS